MSGKGSKPRPFQVSNEEYAARWDAIFARDHITPEQEAALQEMTDFAQSNGLYDEVIEETNQSILMGGN